MSSDARAESGCQLNVTFIAELISAVVVLCCTGCTGIQIQVGILVQRLGSGQIAGICILNGLTFCPEAKLPPMLAFFRTL